MMETAPAASITLSTADITLYAKWLHTDLVRMGTREMCGYTACYKDGFSWQPTGVTAIAEVGTKQPNHLGLFDMSGNIFEWCWDWEDSYPPGPETDYRGPSSGSNRIKRGTGWNDSDGNLQLGMRDFDPPDTVNVDFGLRVVRSD
jgi:formylglycine-generating enzyme required for sulfatase activity